MQVITNSLKLSVYNAAAYVNRKAVMPIMQCLLIEHDAGFLTVTGSDIDNECRMIVDDKSSGPRFSVCVNAKTMREACAALSRPTVTLEVLDSKLVIVDGTSTVTVPIEGEGADYPRKPDVTGKRSVITGSQWNVLVAKVAPVCEQRDLGSVLSNVLLKSDGDKINVCGTDGSRMVTAQFQAAPADITLEPVLIPAHIFPRSFGSLFKHIVMTVGERDIKLVSGSKTIICRRGVGQYPNYEQLMPPVGESQGYRVYNRSELVSFCRAVIKRKDNKFHTIATAGLQAGSLTGNIRADFQGHASDKRAIGLSAEYLLDWALQQTTEQVKMLLTGAFDGKSSFYLKPLMLEDDQYSEFSLRHLLMPVQVKSDWVSEIAQSVEQSGGYSKADEPKISPASKPSPVKRKASVNAAPAPAPKPAPEVKQVTVSACAHLRKLIKNHQLSCRDCNCVIAALR